MLKAQEGNTWPLKNESSNNTKIQKQCKLKKYIFSAVKGLTFGHMTLFP